MTVSWNLLKLDNRGFVAFASLVQFHSSLDSSFVVHFTGAAVLVNL